MRAVILDNLQKCEQMGKVGHGEAVSCFLSLYIYMCVFLSENKDIWSHMKDSERLVRHYSESKSLWLRDSPS